jgi:hypothetical protein
MALSDANEVKVCQILQVTPMQLDSQLEWLGTGFTSTMQTAVEAQITLWDAGAATNFTNIDPKEKNFGARINAGSARSAIRERIAILLERPDWAQNGSGTRLQRG